MLQVAGMSWSCELKDLNKFVASALPNEKFIYYVGYSISETIIGKELAKITYNWSAHGRIYLVQRRISNWEYDYIAIKANIPPVNKLVPFTDEKRREKYHV